MKKHLLWLLYYYSYNIVIFLFMGYLIFYSVFLRNLSIYYTYLLLFLGGLLLGYILADKAYRFLKKNPKQQSR